MAVSSWRLRFHEWGNLSEKPTTGQQREDRVHERSNDPADATQEFSVEDVLSKENEGSDPEPPADGDETTAEDGGDPNDGV